MLCHDCHKPIGGGYWNIPAAGGIVSVCRNCKAIPRYPQAEETPLADDVRRELRGVARILKDIHKAEEN